MQGCAVPVALPRTGNVLEKTGFRVALSTATGVAPVRARIVDEAPVPDAGYLRSDRDYGPASIQLLRGDSQLAIVHERTVYFLRRTRFGKLILTK